MFPYYSQRQAQFSCKQYFQVDNATNAQRIITKGLPTEDPQVKGQLFVNSGTDNILRVSAG